MAKKDKKPWDLPAPQSRCDNEASSLYLNVGIALSTFEMMQVNLSFLFSILVRSESLALLRAYGTLESIPNKVRMAQYAAAVTLAEHTELRERTEVLLNEIERFSNDG
jgi:hypothetical protein